MEGITGLTIYYTVIIIFLPFVLYCLFIYRERIKLFFSFFKEIGVLIVILKILIYCCFLLALEYIGLKYKKIKKSISCYSLFEYIFLGFGLIYVVLWIIFSYPARTICKKIYNLFWGEKIVFLDAIVISVSEDKSFGSIDTSSNNVILALRLQEITDHYINIMGQRDLIKIPFSSVDAFFPGMKTDIICKRYWFDKKYLYFKNFI